MKWASSVSQLEKVEDALEAVVGEVHARAHGDSAAAQRVDGVGIAARFDVDADLDRGYGTSAARRLGSGTS